MTPGYVASLLPPHTPHSLLASIVLYNEGKQQGLHEWERDGVRADAECPQPAQLAKSVRDVSGQESTPATKTVSVIIW